MSANEVATNNVNTKENTNDNESGAVNNSPQIWGSETHVSGQNPGHYPVQFYDPTQVGYDMSAYATAPIYQYSGVYPQYTGEGYQQNYDENYQNAEGLAAYDGSTNQHYQYGIPPDQNAYYTQQTQDGQDAYNKKNMGLFDNSSEYTAHWVSSTTQIPANLKVSPDHPAEASQNAARDFTNWNEARSEYTTDNTAGTQKNSQQEALDQQLSQMNLGYGQQQYGNYNYQVTPITGQTWQHGTFTPQEKKTDQNVQNKRLEFHNAANINAPEFANSAASAKPGAPGQASWAEMVKKNGVSSGDIKIIRQPPPQPSPTQNVQTTQRTQGYNRNPQQKYDRNFNGQKNYKNNNRPPNDHSNQQVAQFNMYGNQPQQAGGQSKGNNQQRNGMPQKAKNQNVRPNVNVGYAGFGSTARPGTSTIPPGNYPVPSEYNPYVPPPPLLHFNPRAQGSGPAFQQPQNAPIYPGNPYLMYPGQQQMRYFNPQFVVRPEQMVPPMYNMNDPYFPMRFRHPFEFGPPMYGMSRYRHPRGNNRQNGKGGKMHNKQRPGSKEGNSVNSNNEKDKEQKENGKLDEALAESVNRGPEFDRDNNATPEPKGDDPSVEIKDDNNKKEEQEANSASDKTEVQNDEKRTGTADNQ